MTARLRISGAVLTLGLLVAACGSDDDTAGTESTSEEATGGPEATAGVCTEDRVGGSLTVSTSGGLETSMDPSVSPGGSAQGGLEQLAVYGSLLRYDARTGDFVGQLAESIEANEDASEWTLKLREGGEFGNGDAFDAEAVKAWVDRNLDPGVESSLRVVRKFIQAVEVIDPLTLRFVLTEPWGFFPVHLSAGGGTVGSLGMVPNVRLLEERGVDAFGQDSTGGGAGPFELASWAAPERVVVEAKQDWWGGPVCIEEIEFVDIRGGQAQLDSMRTGELDFGVIIRDPEAIEAAAAEFEDVLTIYPGGNQLEFNLAAPELDDERVREAIALAIDANVINDRAFGGREAASKGLIPEEDELLEATEGIEHDADAAAELVEDLKADGMSLSFELITGDPPANVESAIAIEAMLERAGFDITVTPMPTTQAISRVRADRNFELFLGGQVGGPETLYSSLFRYNSENPANYTSFKEPAFDAALEELRMAQGAEELQRAVARVQEQLNELVPTVVYASTTAGSFWREGLEGLTFTGGITPYFDQAYIAR